MKTLQILLLLCLVLFISVIANLKFGNFHTDWATLFGYGNRQALEIVWQLRWSTVFTAAIVGGMLSLAGALLQLLLRNPLADPYILGISGGAATANLLGLLFGLSVHWLHITGFIGAGITVLLVYLVAGQIRRFDKTRLLLVGVVMAAGWGAVISLILSLAPNTSLRGLLFWLMGDVTVLHTPYWAGLVLLICTGYSFYLAPQCNLLLHGELKAQSLGIKVDFLQLQLYIISAVLTACAVNIAGTIGFVGLIVPHLLRLAHKADHKFIIPGCVLLGASLLAVANLIAKQWLMIPIGIVTALLGIPLFLLLLIKQ